MERNAEGRFGQNRAAWMMPGRMAPADHDIEGARPMTCATDRCYIPRCMHDTACYHSSQW